jgi:hypothetical protein
LSWSLSISNVSFEKISAIITEFGSIEVNHYPILALCEQC